MSKDRERRMNGHYDPLDRNHFSMTIESSSSAASSSLSFSTPTKLLPVSSPPPSLSAVGVGVGGGGLSYIEHPVSKFDTLAGVAIKYGVEVADIKRINGLVTDHQMFALKTLQIPLPGRHPPSPILANGLDNQGPSSSERTPPTCRHSDFLDSFQSLKLKASPPRKVSSAMSSLQGYYGLRPAEQKVRTEGFEMAVYRKGGAHYLEDVPFNKSSPPLNPPLSHHRKSKSAANGFLTENGDFANQDTGDSLSDKWIDKLIRRRQKSEVDLNARTPDMLLKEDNSIGGVFSALAGKGLALRPKSATRTVSGADAEAGNGNGDFVVVDNSGGVRKSSSTSSLQESESSTSSIWSTSKWTLKPDLQVLSTAAITRPIFDGLPKPITGRKSKAALD